MFEHCLNFRQLEITRVKGVLIPMWDSIYLSADLCLLSDQLWKAKDWVERLFVVVEYIPYRKDGVIPGERFIEYLLRRKYIVACMDMRGTGAVQGVNTDEYLPQEQIDGFDTVERLVAQP